MGRNLEWFAKHVCEAEGHEHQDLDALYRCIVARHHEVVLGVRSQ